MRKNMKSAHYSPFLLLILVSVLGLTPFSFGCAMPRIIVLKDSLAPEEHLTLGVAYEKKGETDQALRQYTLAAEKLSTAFLYLGNAYFQKGEFNQSEKYYLKSIKETPDQADAYNNLAWLYCIIGKNLDQAEILALKAMKINPDKGNIYQDTLDKIRMKLASTPARH